ncbi:glycosyltransferase [Azospirillum sp. RWY-5-1]|uniref:Glycosyltransferase n=1 Tax=Azospirillum oleiclasticum TaxID=2735135 RepID=A0ABX2TJS2_9PROT|nr:glycosyltransferase [Azospirillum oleiclasticum]NYZ17918.1 glycosyltransferase [Azospirillum oleiclasticum]NYZ24600.1 glycosyltransferase [Azospirillum oleiclasticum]
MPRLLLVNYEYPPLGGGAANATANMARELAMQGVEVTVLTAAFGALPRRETTPAGVRIHRIPSLRRRADRSSVVEMLAFLALSLPAAALLARRWRPDATIAFFGVPGGPAGWLLKALSGVPYVVSLRGGDVPGFQYDGIALFHRLAGPVIGFLWRRAAAVVANSDGLAELARRFAPDVPVTVVPNGVDAALFRPLSPPSPPRGEGWGEGETPATGFPAPRAGAEPPHPALSPEGRGFTAPLRLLVVGRLVRQKGVDLILEAMARTPVPLDLTVVGDGGARPALEAQAAALGLQTRVRFAGWLERTALPDAYRAADLFVFPSRDEGMPNVVLEAMATGLPVAATDIAGNRDLVVDGETGFLLPVDDVAALTAALERLAANPDLRRRMGAAGRRRVVERFSWAAVATAYRGLALGVDRVAAAPAYGRRGSAKDGGS